MLEDVDAAMAPVLAQSMGKIAKERGVWGGCVMGSYLGRRHRLRLVRGEV